MHLYFWYKSVLYSSYQVLFCNLICLFGVSHVFGYFIMLNRLTDMSSVPNWAPYVIWISKLVLFLFILQIWVISHRYLYLSFLSLVKIAFFLITISLSVATLAPIFTYLGNYLPTLVNGYPWWTLLFPISHLMLPSESTFSVEGV